MDLPLRTTVRGISLAIFLAVTALASPAQARAPLDISIPRPTGANAVGTRAIELVDRSRPMGFGLEGRRRLMVQLTYPIDSQATCRPAAYAPKPILQRLQEQTLVATPLSVDSGICDGGRIKGGARPLVIFSHGFALDRLLYAALTSDLASRGFIVASVDHTGDAFSVRFPHTGYVDGVFGGPFTDRQLTGDELQALVDVRAPDLSFVLSRIRKLGRDPKGLLAGHVGKRAGVFGHSLGGATATQAAVVDERFDAAASLDSPLWGGPATTTGATIPYLLAMAEGGFWRTFRARTICDFYSASTGPKDAWLLSDALHNSFNDLQVLAPEIARQDPAWPLANSYQTFVGTIDPTASIDSQRRALGAFFSAHLKHGGKPGGPSPPGSFAEAPAAGLVCG